MRARGASDHGRGNLVGRKQGECPPEREEVRRCEEENADGACVATELPVENRSGDRIVVVGEDLWQRGSIHAWA